MRILSFFLALPLTVSAASAVIPSNSFDNFDAYWKWVASGTSDRSAGLTMS